MTTETTTGTTATRRSIFRPLWPIVVLALGVAGRFAVQPDDSRTTSVPLSAFPDAVAGFELQEEENLRGDELTVLRPDDYLLRSYQDTRGRAMSLFVAFYGQQTSGASIHSPRNCLPGSGWEPLRHDRIRTPTVYGMSQVNRYLVEHGSGARALVYYWYQGRGRVAANEYTVKLDLLRDALFRGRTDEALVRLVLPVDAQAEGLARADAIAATTVREVIRLLAAHVPA
jgi:EpsI family protein